MYNDGSSTLTLNHSLISGNTALDGAEVFNFGFYSANNHNIFGHSGLTNAQAFYGFTPGPTDITATSDGNAPTALNAILETTLADNGGLTETLALVEGSPAIDAIPDSSCPPPDTDQRGYTRPVDGNDSNGEECDIGAYEFDIALLNDQVTFAPIPGTFQTTPGPGALGCPVSFEGGAFSFEARLKNKSSSPPLRHLGVQVITLSNGNELLLDPITGTTGGVGATLSVPTDGGYADEILNPNEQVNVPFTICLQNSNSFAFFVDVFGQKLTPWRPMM